MAPARKEQSQRQRQGSCRSAATGEDEADDADRDHGEQMVIGTLPIAESRRPSSRLAQVRQLIFIVVNSKERK